MFDGSGSCPLPSFVNEPRDQSGDRRAGSGGLGPTCRGGCRPRAHVLGRDLFAVADDAGDRVGVTMAQAVVALEPGNDRTRSHQGTRHSWPGGAMMVAEGV